MIIYLPDGNSNLNEYRDFADVDLIVTDLDGTLIDGAEPVLKQIRKLLNRLRKKHIQITVATGRTFWGAESRIKELGISIGMPIALYNGGVVIEYGTENVLYASYVPDEVLIKLLSVVDMRKTNIYVYTFSIKDSFLRKSDNQNGILEEVYCWGERQTNIDVNGMPVKQVHYVEQIKENISAVLIDNRLLTREESEIIKLALKHYCDIKITDSGNGFIEIKGGGINKGVIYSILKGNKKFSTKKILAIGDNDNDIELFEGADISVAVANSSKLAFQYADYICDNKSAKGFLDMLYVLDNAKKYYY